MKFKKVLLALTLVVFVGVLVSPSLGILKSKEAHAQREAPRIEFSAVVSSPPANETFFPGQEIKMYCDTSSTDPSFTIWKLVYAWSQQVDGTTRSGALQTIQNISYPANGSYSANVIVPADAQEGPFSLQCIAYFYGNESYENSATNGVDVRINRQAVIDVTPPALPTNFSISPITSSTLRVSWLASSDTTSIEIYRTLPGSTQFSNNPIAVVSGSESPYNDRGLVSGTRYRYKLKARDAAGNLSGFTPIAFANTLIVNVPTNFQVTLPTTSNLYLSWNTPAGLNTFNYGVYMNQGGSTPMSTTPVTYVANGQNGVTIQGLQPSTTYKFQIATFDDANNRSSLSSTKSGTTLTPTVAQPSTPLNLSITGSTHNSINLSWSASTGAGGAVNYSVFRSTSQNGAYSAVANSLTGLTVSDTSVSSSSTYWYKVKACYVSAPTNCSTDSSAVSATTSSAPDVTAPTVPANLSVSATTVNSISLTWATSTDTGGSGLAGYKIYRSSTSGGTYSEVGTVLVNANPPLTFTNSGLTSGTTYFYKVAAYDAASPANVSGQSGSVSGATLSAPNAPSAVTVTLPTISSLTVSWTGPTPANATSYNIYRGTTTANINTTTPVGTVNAPTTSFEDRNLASGTTYFYKVAAVNSVGQSPLSTSTGSGTTSSPQITVASVNLVNATGGATMQALTSGQTINIGNQNGTGSNITIVANTNPSPAGSVKFSLTKPNGQIHTINENALPYSLFADTNATTLNPWQDLQIGGHTLVVTPYSGENGTGQAGVPQTILLNIVNNDDLTPPFNPENVTLIYRSASEMRLVWVNSTSPDVSSYRIYRNNVLVGSSSVNSFTDRDTTLNGLSSYAYKVTAIDTSGNEATLPTTSASSLALSTNFSQGSQVSTTSATDVKAAPESSSNLGTQATNSRGAVTSGPIWVIGGSQYWQVDFESGVDGWVNQNTIQQYVPPAANSVTITSPVENSQVAMGQSITMTCNYSSNPKPYTLVGAYYIYPSNTGGQLFNIAGTSLPSGGSYTQTVALPAGVQVGKFGVQCIGYFATGEPGTVSSSYDINITAGAGDTTAPVTSITAPVNNATVSGTVAITATATDAVGVTRVEFYDGSTLLGSTTSLPYSYSWNTVLVANGSKTLTAKAYDAANNVGTSAARTVTVNNADTTVPNITSVDISGDTNWVLPAGTTSTTLTVVTDENATCKWSDTNVAYASMANTMSGSSTSHTSSLTGLTNGTSYLKYVRCQDTAGNAMTSSQSVNFSVLPTVVTDTTPPTANITAPTASQQFSAGTTSTNFTVTTNEAATCRWGATDMAYGSMTEVFTGTGSTSHSYSLIGLTNGTSYTRHVRCQDTAGNAMASSQSVTFSVASAPTGTDQVSTTCPSSPTPLNSNPSTNISVALCSAVSNTVSPATITLRWTPVSGRTVNSATISRKTEDGSWSQVGTAGSGSTTWTDTSFTPGTYYEYKVVLSTSTGTATGYIASGINVPSNATRGKIVLVIDNTFQTSLATQIQNLTNELNADRWVVSPIYVNRTDTPTSVRNSIKAIYDADPSNTKAVYLLGHVPVATLGNANPDGHVNRGISSDAFYGEMSSSWSSGCSITLPQGLDTGVSANLDIPPTSSRFCVSTSNLPSTLELEVGRVDMYKMPAFGGTEASLLTTYLNKVSNFKKKVFVPADKAFVKDTWINNGWSHGKGAMSTFPSLVNSNNVTVETYWTRLKDAMGSQSYKWVSASYNGVNTSESVDGISGSMQDMVSNPHKGVFNIQMASYSAEWNDQNSLLRSFLASGDGMSSMIGGSRYVYLHQMGMGKTVGNSFKRSIDNNSSTYPPLGGIWDTDARGNSHMTLLGDPTLRDRYVSSPSNLTLSNSSGKVAMNWSASSDSGVGYNVYEIGTSSITRLNASPVTSTSFTSNVNFVANKKFMVTRVKIEQVNSGTYYNESLGTSAETSGGVPPTDTTAPTAPVPLSFTATGTSSSTISLDWADYTDSSAPVTYKVYRNGSQIGTSNTSDYQDSGLSASTSYSYTIVACDSAPTPNCTSQSAATIATTSGTTNVNAGSGGEVLGLMGAVGPDNTENVTPGANPFGLTDYYVSCDGNDSNNGTSSSTPWKTLLKIDSVKYNLQPGSRVMLKRGCPEYQGYFHIVSSGTLARPIEYSAYGSGSAPIVSGKTAVTGWTNHSGNIWKANIGVGLTPKYLFVDGDVQTMAQTPNAGSWLYTDSRTTTSITDSGIGALPNGSLVGKKMIIRSEPWAWTERVVSTHSGSTITVPYTHMLGNWEDTGWAFAFKDSLDFLNAPGEWYYNPSTGILYFQAPGNVNPSTLNVGISARDFGFDFGYNKAFVKIKNIILEGFEERGIRLEDNKGVTIQNVEIRKSSRGIMGGTGFGNPASDATKIQNNYIHDIFGPDGIWFLGSNGNIIEGNVVEKIWLNPMTDISPTEWANGFGIRIIHSSSNFIVRNNIVRETGYIGLVFSGTGSGGVNSLVEKNLVSKADMMANDGGGISFDHVDGVTVQDNIVKDTSFETSLMSPMYAGYKPIAFDYYFGNTSIKNLILRRNVSINSPSTGVWRDSDLGNTGIQVLDNVFYGAGDQGIGMSLFSVKDDFPTCDPSGNSPCFITSFNDVWSGNKVYQTASSQNSVYQLQTYSNGSDTPTKFGNWSNNYFFNPFVSNKRTFQELRHYNSSQIKVGDQVKVVASSANVRSTNDCSGSTVLGTQPQGSVGIVQAAFGTNCFQVVFPSGSSGWVYRWSTLEYANRTLSEWMTYVSNSGSGNTTQSYTLSSQSQMPPIYVNETSSPKTVNIGTGKCNSAGQALPSSYTLQNFASVIVPENCSNN